VGQEVSASKLVERGKNGYIGDILYSNVSRTRHLSENQLRKLTAVKNAKALSPAYLVYLTKYSFYTRGRRAKRGHFVLICTQPGRANGRTELTRDN
jgi:hypothetical protein